MKNAEFWASLIGAIVVAFVIAIWVPGDPDKKVVHAIEYGALVITFLFGFMVLAAIASGKIDISGLLQEKGAPGGGASMSRFQLLIFTFVVAISLLLIVVSSEPRAFPSEIPVGVLTLLGISATTYAVSKGIQSGAADIGDDTDDEAGTDAVAAAVVHQTVVSPPEQGGTVVHTTTITPPATETK